MQRITQKSLNQLAEAITRAAGNGHTYTAGQHFGLTWTLCRGSHALLHADSKGKLHELMGAMLVGLMELDDRKQPEQSTISLADESALPLIWEMQGHKGVREYCRKQKISYSVAYDFLQKQGV